MQWQDHDRTCRSEVQTLYEVNLGVFAQALPHEQNAQQLEHRLELTENLLQQQIRFGSDLAQRAADELRNTELRGEEQGRQTRQVSRTTADASQAAERAQRASAEFQHQDALQEA